MKNLSTLADSVLAQVEGAARVKEAEDAASKTPRLQTETGAALLKIATELKNVASARITYTDLARFRKAYDV